MARDSDLLQIAEAGIDAVRPSLIFPPIFDQPPEVIASWLKSSQRFLLAMGKASIDSAKTILTLVKCNDSFVLTPYEDPARLLKVHIGSHPVPDQTSYDSTVQLVEWLRKLPPGGSLLVILSGGASALCVLPLSTIGLDTKMKVNDLLIRSGATIQEINMVRKHLSAVKGGRLALRVSHLDTRVLVISDVIGNDLSTIGSGPFYADPTTFLDAWQVLQKYSLWNRVPDEVRRTIEDGCAGRIPETPKPGSVQLDHRIVASNDIARNAAAERARLLGYSVRNVEQPVKDNVELAAENLFAEIKQSPPRTAFIAGGEVTVRLQGHGVGGRNQHLALLMTDKLNGQEAVFGAVGTDGIDGNSTAAGAWTDGKTFQKASGIDTFRSAVKNCDSFHYFRAVGQNIMTGPTGTNVMDLYIALT